MYKSLIMCALVGALPAHSGCKILILLQYSVLSPAFSMDAVCLLTFYNLKEPLAKVFLIGDGRRVTEWQNP